MAIYTARAGWDEDMTDDEKEIEKEGRQDDESGKWDMKREWIKEQEICIRNN